MELHNFKINNNDGVLIITWDMPNSSVNLINELVMTELNIIIDHVVSDSSIKGAVITSAKKGFSGGADLSILKNSKNRYQQYLKDIGPERAMNLFFEESRRLSILYRRIEKCSKPFAAAIHGVCLGGAFELALACHHRVMLADDKTKVGLPEVKLGLFPGAGGTQRVARLTETDKALQFLLKGNPVDAVKALELKLVHEITPDLDPVVLATQWIQTVGDAVAPWDKKDFKNPSGKVFSPKGMMVWPAANAHYRKETYDNYPGARAILTAVYEGLQVNIDTGLLIEARLFTNVLQSKVVEAMIGTLFMAKNDLDKGARRPTNIPPTNLKKVGIIGAGLMGAGIAYVSALSGLDVVLIDTTEEKIQAGKDTIAKLASGQVSRKKMSEQAKDDLLARVNGTMYYESLRDVDLVIEAVFEDRELKDKVFQTVQEVVGLDTIIASNTSTLPITSLADSLKDPGKFIGIHFFSPVDKMLLVEVIMGKNTNELALATALDFVRMIKKTPIVVNDCRGFYANRCVLNYVLEGHLMLREGVPAAMIENAAKMAGMPVGPLALNDEVGLDLGWKILQATKKDLGADAVNPLQEDLLEFMVVHNERYGRKNGKGFYEYEGTKQLWDGLVIMQNEPLDPDTIDVEELKTRLLVVQAIEAARTIEEGITTEEEANVGSVLGFGFAPFTGGTISYIKQMGTENFVDICDKLAAKFGSRFNVPQSLRG